MQKKSKNFSAFSLIELSIVILIIGILVAGVTQGSRLVKQMRLSVARSMTTSSPVASIKDLILWFETTREQSLSQSLNDGDQILTWTSVNPQVTDLKSLQSAVSLRPLYEEDGIGGLPSVNFDADLMTLTGNTLTANYTVFAVFRFASLSVSDESEVLIFHDTATEGHGLALEVQTNATMRNLHRSPVGSTAPENNLYSVSPNLVVAKKDYILSSVRNSVTATTNLWMNNVAFITNGSASLAAFNSNDLTLCLGRLSIGNPARPTYGFISEIIVFDRALKQADIDEVEAYLSKKYSIRI